VPDQDQFAFPFKLFGHEVVDSTCKLTGTIKDLASQPNRAMVTYGERIICLLVGTEGPTGQAPSENTGELVWSNTVQGTELYELTDEAVAKAKSVVDLLNLLRPQQELGVSQAS